MRALLLHIGSDVYAVPMRDAREVLDTPALTELPTSPAAVLGLCNLRGEIVPVFDTGVLLGLGPVPMVNSVTIVETALGPAGLATSDRGESVELGDTVAVTEGPGTAGAFAVDDGLAVLIDVEVLLSPARVGG